jgi:acyl carrier protein
MHNIPNNLEEEIRGIIADIVEVEPQNITLDAKLVEDLGMDSIKAVEIIVAIEQKYKIRIREEEIPKIATLRQAVELAKRVIKEKKE